MPETGIHLRAVEVLEAVDSGVIGDVDCVGGIRVGRETWVFEHAAVEDEFEHKRVGSVPAV